MSRIASIVLALAVASTAAAQDSAVESAVDAFGERWANTANTFKTPAVTTVGLGARSRFVLVGRPAELRVLASKLTGAAGYWAAPSGVFSPIAPRTVRAMLTVTFGRKGA